MEKIPLALDAQQILNDPLLNKGSAFTLEERDELGLHGLLPYHISTIEEQVIRRYDNFHARHDPLSRYLFLSNLQNRNEILFYRLVSEHIEEMLPLIYTPTVGEVSLRYSMLFGESRGLYLSYPMREKIPEIFSRLQKKEVDIIVVTDGQRILGLGDLGIGGMAIPLGKLALYTLFGGINPARTLPVLLDVGTDNPELLGDPLYLGWRHSRINGREYDGFVDLFVQELKKRYPNVLLQWEDFGRDHAKPLLSRYRDTLCSFNDDIQGTAATVLAAAFAAVRAKKENLKEQKIALLGAGSAGLGIARVLAQAMQVEGLREEEALKRFYLVDIDGLIHTRLKSAGDLQKRFAQPFEEISRWSINDPSCVTLLDVVKNAQPSILIGVSTQSGAFTEEIVKELSRFNERPIIFPLSNPTSKSEADPKDLLEWTNGKAIIATGSPFAAVNYKEKTYPIPQCNNVYIFPGVGLGTLVARARKVTDKMFLVAAECLSEHAPLLQEKEGSLFPSFSMLRTISQKIALRVAKMAQEEGVAEKISEKDLEGRLKKEVWSPNYPIYTRRSG